MLSFLFDPSGFLPRWESGTAWESEPWLGWMHVVADVVTAVAFVTIPITILLALRRGQHLPAPRLLFLFAVFIFACSMVQMTDAVTFWYPLYRLSAIAKCVLAITSSLTAALLVASLTRLLKYKSPELLQEAVDRQTLKLAEVAKELEQATVSLREQKERLQLALAAGEMGTWDWNIETGMIRGDANEVTMLELVGEFDSETDELVYHADQFFAMVHPDDKDLLNERVRVALEQGVPYLHTFRVTTPSGLQKWLVGRGRLINEAGEPRRMVGINYDVTETKRIELELAEAKQLAEASSEAKSRFLANTSHEIRTPLTAILGCAESIIRDTDDESTRESATLIQRQGGLLRQLLSDILDLSKIESGSVNVDCDQVCDTHALLEDVRSVIRPIAVEKGLAFELSIDSKVSRHIKTDGIRLRQLLLNLASNAVKYTQAGSIHIKADRLDTDSLRFSVCDTGPGIPLDEQMAVFEAFHQVDEDSDDEPGSHSVNGGVGLGLAISDGIAQLLGGQLELQSKVGEGSTFSLALPIIEPTAEELARLRPVARASGDALTPGKLLQGRLLVAEDTPSIQFLLRKILQPHATELRIVDNGRSLLEEHARSHEAGEPYDVILLDMNMPVLSGYEAAQRLRAAGVTTPIIALTASVMVGDQEKCLAAGCSAYVSKPIEWEVLEVEVQRALRA